MSIKKTVRKEALERRNMLRPEDRTLRSLEIFSFLERTAFYQEAKFVHIYASFGSEVPTDRIMRSALKAGKRVAVPVTRMKEKRIELSEIFDPDRELGENYLGIPEPDPGCIRPVEPQRLDLIIMPGVAFDRFGVRLGYGSGLYDRLLEQIADSVPLAALAFREQVIDFVLSESHDRPMDYLVTDSGILDCKSDREGQSSKEGDS